MSDTYFPNDPDRAPIGITVGPRVQDLVTQEAPPETPANPLEYLYGSPAATAQDPTHANALTKILASAMRDAKNFVVDTATAPYRLVNAAARQDYGKGLDTEIDPEMLTAALSSAGLVMGGGMPMAPKGAVGMSGGRLIQPPKVEGPFYSAVEHAVANAPQDKMSVTEWKNWLRNQPGVKAEELDWMGLGSRALHPKEWGAKPVTREQLLEHAQGHGVQIKEIEKTGEAETGLHEDDLNDLVLEEVQQYFDSQPTLKALHHDDVDSWLNTHDGQRFYDNAAADLQQQYGDNLENGTKYHEYQLPGGDNYRETLLTLPEKKGKLSRESSKILGQINKHYPDTYHSILDGTVTSDEIAGLERTGIAYDDDIAKIRKELKGSGDQSFRSSHWDEPNVLVHMRMNDRELPDIGKSLHLEEIQSDWHQQGRKQGYKQPVSVAEPIGTLTKLPEGYKLNKTEIPANPGRFEYKVTGPDGENVGYIQHTEEEAIKSALNWLNDPSLLHTHNNLTRVPDAPFKSTWADLALKRAITKAAREGYDAISWTPGAQQVERYDLSKRLEKVRIKANDNGTYDVFGWPKGTSGLNNAQNFASGVSKEKLADTIGKDLAEKVIGDKIGFRPGGVKDYEGLDLKVGGEGMKAFYDKMLVDKVNALGKKFGAKVEYQTLGREVAPPRIHQTDYGFEFSADGEMFGPYPTREFAEKRAKEHMEHVNKGTQNFKVPVLRLTPKLREIAERRGMPLFAKGLPFQFTPVDHDPFNKDERK